MRQWLTQQVVPALRQSGAGTAPAMGAMHAQGGEVTVLYWQDEPWVRLKDMPAVLPRSRPQKAPWWRVWA